MEDEAAVTKRITKWRVPKMKDYLKNHSLDSEGLKAALCQRIVASMLHPTAAPAPLLARLGALLRMMTAKTTMATMTSTQSRSCAPKSPP